MAANSNWFYALLRGETSGWAAALARFGLSCAAIPYRLAVCGRNFAYDHGWFAAHCLSVPVVSVGNLTLGGTGKTPMVEWIARRLRDQGLRVGVVSRGYGALPGQINDEARELAQRLPDVPHLQNPDRLTAARRAVAEWDCQVIVLDDGFQHRRVARRLDIVLLDALEPFGFGRIFPRGTLREPVSGLRRADWIVLSRAGAVEPRQREAIRRRVATIAPQASWAEADHAPRSLRNASGREEPIAWLAGRAVAAFCGIGNPAGFRHTLRACDCRVVAFREFPDHCPYAPSDLDSLAAWIQQLDVDAVVCTHKDLVKLPMDELGGQPLWAVGVALQFLAGETELQSRLESLCPKACASPRAGLSGNGKCFDAKEAEN